MRVLVDSRKKNKTQVMGSVQPPPPPARRFPMWREGLAAPAHLNLNLNLITSAAAQRLGTIAHRQFRGFILRSSMSSSMGLSQFSRVCGLKNAWLESAKQLNGVDFFASSYISFSARCSSCLCFFSKKDTVENVDDDKNLYIKTPNKKPFNGRLWTNVLLAINVLMYVAQIASQGKLILMGAKINSLIDKGELWRLATSSFLHANVGHLMVNCYSLDSIGPTMENISGPRRFLAIYFTSAIASSATSYWFCKAPAVGASGAIFGLVGSYAVFMLRHRYIFGGAKQDLQHIAQVISLNMVIGILSKGIDNWGHLGGLLGGVAISWFVGPAWKYEPRSKDGILAFADKAPIFYLRKAK